MELSVNLSELQIETSKMYGLNGLLAELSRQKVSYQFGLSKVVEFVNHNNGKVIDLPDNETRVIIGDEEAICFQPYQDVNFFNYVFFNADITEATLSDWIAIIKVTFLTYTMVLLTPRFLLIIPAVINMYLFKPKRFNVVMIGVSLISLAVFKI